MKMLFRRYLPKINSHSEPPVSERDIPRRLIRRGNNKTHSNLQPLLVWNHQLLPNFYNKRQPPFFMNSLRRDGYPSNTKNTLAVKRSGGWVNDTRLSQNVSSLSWWFAFNYSLMTTRSHKDFPTKSSITKIKVGPFFFLKKANKKKERVSFKKSFSLSRLLPGWKRF